METFITSKNIKIFTCEKCNFKCSKRGDYNRHLATDKHRRKHMETENTSITSDDYMCDVVENIEIAQDYGNIVKNVLF